jgi:hypothetical protein
MIPKNHIEKQIVVYTKPRCLNYVNVLDLMADASLE